MLPAKLSNDIEARVLWTGLEEIINLNYYIWAWTLPFSPDQNKIYYESYETLDPIIY